MLRNSFFTLALILVASVVSAETKPFSAGSDPRIKRYTFSQNTVYRLDLAMKHITSLEFDQAESIESVLMGDSESWQVIRLQRGNVLAVKPLINGASTNMTVYTSGNVYTFELRALTMRTGSASLNYRIDFRYLDQERAAQAAARERNTRPRDYRYYVAGEADFAPVSVYDDDHATYFQFPDNVRRAAIFRVDAQGRESIVNVQQTENGSVVSGTSDRWTIRIGDEEICIAHGRVIRTVPNNGSAKALNAAFINSGTAVAGNTLPATDTQGLPK